MPFRRALFLGAALSIVAASAGFAQTVPSNGPDGPYVRVEGGWSHLDDANSTGSAAGPPHFKSMFDEGYIFGGAGGYKWGPWRAELNVDWSQNAVKKVQDNGGLGFGSPPANGDVDKLSFMINGYYDWITGTP